MRRLCPRSETRRVVLIGESARGVIWRRLRSVLAVSILHALREADQPYTVRKVFRTCLDAAAQKRGEPSRDRTEDPLIKSQVLCQLS
jgi:hypothetical protein